MAGAAKNPDAPIYVGESIIVNGMRTPYVIRSASRDRHGIDRFEITIQTADDLVAVEAEPPPATAGKKHG